MEVPYVGCRTKFHFFDGCRLTDFQPLSVVNKSQLIIKNAS